MILAFVGKKLARWSAAQFDAEASRQDSARRIDVTVAKMANLFHRSLL